MSKKTDKLRANIASCLQRDRHRFSQAIARIERKAHPTGDQAETAIEQIASMIEASMAVVDRRTRLLPQSTVDGELPIAQRRDEIVDAIHQNQVVIISGETGSGKSTQLPLIALQMGFGRFGFIGHTQPRRIAARSIAARIANQLNTRLGEGVGFKIRFDDKTNDNTFVKLMTDGMLLAETQTDRFFSNYEMIIIDEAHERSLNIDFLLGTLKRILPKRPELKLIITSATIDTQRFAEHFSTTETTPPIIHIEGRTYPVEIRYEPQSAEGENRVDSLDHVATVTRQVVRNEDGDVLVFLPTEADIKTTHKKLRSLELDGSRLEIHPLYARLSANQQAAIFQPGTKRRIVLATNVAESSVTVPRISTVIDSGTARISRYAARSKVQRLPIEAISQASAKQRSGRCGRIGPGLCIRLYSEEDFLNRAEFTTPEVRRTNLASVILQTLSLKLGNIADFPFIDPPHADAIADGFRTLFEIGAIDNRKQLTPLGRKLSKLPVDPRIARMLFAAADEGCLSEMLIIAAALEVPDARIRPAEKQQQADNQHEKFRNGKSDFMSFLTLWDFFHKLKTDLTRSQFRKACQQNFLSLNHIHQWQEVHRQLKAMVRQNGLKTNSRKDDYNAIHRSLLCGLLSGVAMLTDRHEFTGAGGIKFHLWPGSGVFNAKPKWIVAGEVVETAKRYGRIVAKIAPDWLEPISSHLVKRNYVDPHWSKKRQSTMAYENVLLFGLPIVNRRRIGYAKIDGEIARQFFIEHGLVESQVNRSFGFLDHNRQLLDDLEMQAAKSRKGDYVVDAQLLFQFYDHRLPEDCCDTAALTRCLKRDGKLDQRLRLHKSDLNIESDDVSDLDFPDQIPIGNMNIPIEYCFQPGDASDGATIQIPRDVIGQIDESQTNWMIPGLFEQHVVALIKSLPKSLRRNLVPAPEKASQVLAAIQQKKGSFLAAVAKELSKISGDRITPAQFHRDKIPDNLKLNIRVLDNDGHIVAEGRDINALKKQFQSTEASGSSIDDSQWHQDGLTEWSWGDIPGEIEIDRGFAVVTLFPAVVDQDETVGLRLLDSPERARQATSMGLVKLFSIRKSSLLKKQIKWLPDFQQHAIQLSPIIDAETLKKDLATTISRIAIGDKVDRCRSRISFDQLLDDAVESISIATQTIAKWLPRFSQAVHEASLSLETLPESSRSSFESMNLQIEQLTNSHFLTTVSWKWLQHYPRYFSAISRRCEKLTKGHIQRDADAEQRLQHFVDIYDQIVSEQISTRFVDLDIDQLRWMIEEFRVSQFAQQLGTSMTISEKRLEKQIARIQNH